MHPIIIAEMKRMRDDCECHNLVQTLAGRRLLGHMSRIGDAATWDDLDAMFTLYGAALREACEL
jgi:hypothetical protein